MCDAIIAYVDGTDKTWIENYNKFVKNPLENVESRFRSYDVLDIQVKLIRKFMPFIDKIFIVISNLSQLDHVIDELKKLDKVFIVTHEEIIPKRYLPCFNSCTIEMYLHNIKKLDEKFLYFNDDIFPINETKESDFFNGGNICMKPGLKYFDEEICSVYEHNVINSTKLLYKDTKIYGKYNAIKPVHSVMPMFKSVNERVWLEYHNEIEKSLTRTRHRKNINAYIFLNYLYQKKKYTSKQVECSYFSIFNDFEDINKSIKKSKIICINDKSEYYIDFDEWKKELRKFLECVLEGKEYIAPIKPQILLEDKLYVSFTSWTKRIQYCKHTIDLMMNQSLKPTKIILNLSEEEFPNKELDLPLDLVNEAKINDLFEIYWIKENTNVWKKIIPTMNRFPNDLVLSIDDDIEYPSNYIEEMYRTYCENDKLYPVVGYKFIIDENLCHSGPFTLTSKRFYGDLLNDIYYDIILPTLPEKKWQSDIVYYKVANSLGYNYVKCESINCNAIYNNSKINKEDRYSIWNKEYKNEREENIKLIDNYINNLNYNKQLNIAICAIAKNENLYIREWVEWYKNIPQVNKIFLYDNNDINGENFEEVINDYIESGFVNVINVRGVHKSLEKKYAEKSKYHGTQQDCYEDCFITNKNNYDWILFCDIDEFLVCDNLNLYLNKHIMLNTDIILLNWLIFGDNEELIYSNKPIKERFTNKSELRQYTQVKSLVNCRIDKKMLQIDAHLALFENAIYRDSKYNIVKPEYKKNIVLDNCYIKHYLTKSCEEWILRKYHNTSATGKDYFNNAIDKRIKEFFTFNVDTVEKRNIIHRTMTLMDSVNSKIIVSLTSFGQRLYNDAYITIKSILNQTIKPYKICLTLFTEDLKNIPNNIQNLINENVVELIISDKNLKPHLKYFYAMQKYRDCIIITVDDDHIYESTMIENLLKTYKKYPSCVVARRVHLIKRRKSGDLLPYKKWKFEYSEQLVPGQNLFATGVGGVLYPPNILEISDNNLNDIYKCLNADDIYLKWLETKNHINVVWSPNTSYCGITIQSESTKNNRLQDINLKGTGNDDYLKIFKI